MVDNEYKPDKKVPLVEMFGPTVQGEGTVIGQQTYFLRFGLCDYKCKMCDSMHAVNPAMVKANSQWLTQTEIFEKFWEFRHPDSTDWITFSGGNPAIHDLSELVTLMHQNGMKINVETQGTKWAPWLAMVDSLTISPKGPGMGESHRQDVFATFMHELMNAEPKFDTFGPDLCIKIVIFDQRDLEFAKEIFTYLKEDFALADYFSVRDLSNTFYMSLGNPNPPPINGTEAFFDKADAIVRYKMLYEDICNDLTLSKVRWLPQWHAFVWGNDVGH